MKVSQPNPPASPPSPVKGTMLDGAKKIRPVSNGIKDRMAQWQQVTTPSFNERELRMNEEQEQERQQRNVSVTETPSWQPHRPTEDSVAQVDVEELSEPETEVEKEQNQEPKPTRLSLNDRIAAVRANYQKKQLALKNEGERDGKDPSPDETSRYAVFSGTPKNPMATLGQESKPPHEPMKAETPAEAKEGETKEGPAQEAKYDEPTKIQRKAYSRPVDMPEIGTLLKDRMSAFSHQLSMSSLDEGEVGVANEPSRNVAPARNVYAAAPTPDEIEASKETKRPFDYSCEGNASADDADGDFGPSDTDEQRPPTKPLDMPAGISLKGRMGAYLHPSERASVEDNGGETKPRASANASITAPQVSRELKKGGDGKDSKVGKPDNIDARPSSFLSFEQEEESSQLKSPKTPRGKEYDMPEISWTIKDRLGAFKAQPKNLPKVGNAEETLVGESERGKDTSSTPRSTVNALVNASKGKDVEMPKETASPGVKTFAKPGHMPPHRGSLRDMLAVFDSEPPLQEVKLVDESDVAEVKSPVVETEVDTLSPNAERKAFSKPADMPSGVSLKNLMATYTRGAKLTASDEGEIKPIVSDNLPSETAGVGGKAQINSPERNNVVNNEGDFEPGAPGKVSEPISPGGKAYAKPTDMPQLRVSLRDRMAAFDQSETSPEQGEPLGESDQDGGMALGGNDQFFKGPASPGRKLYARPADMPQLRVSIKDMLPVSDSEPSLEQVKLADEPNKAEVKASAVAMEVELSSPNADRKAYSKPADMPSGVSLKNLMAAYTRGVKPTASDEEEVEPVLSTTDVPSETTGVGKKKQITSPEKNNGVSEEGVFELGASGKVSEPMSPGCKAFEKPADMPRLRVSLKDRMAAFGRSETPPEQGEPLEESDQDEGKVHASEENDRVVRSPASHGRKIYAKPDDTPQLRVSIKDPSLGQVKLAEESGQAKGKAPAVIMDAELSSPNAERKAYSKPADMPSGVSLKNLMATYTSGVKPTAIDEGEIKPALSTTDTSLETSGVGEKAQINSPKRNNIVNNEGDFEPVASRKVSELSPRAKPYAKPADIPRIRVSLKDRMAAFGQSETSPEQGEPLEQSEQDKGKANGSEGNNQVARGPAPHGRKLYAKPAEPQLRMSLKDSVSSFDQSDQETYDDKAPASPALEVKITSSSPTVEPKACERLSDMPTGVSLKNLVATYTHKAQLSMKNEGEDETESVPVKLIDMPEGLSLKERLTAYSHQSGNNVNMGIRRASSQ